MPRRFIVQMESTPTGRRRYTVRSRSGFCTGTAANKAEAQIAVREYLATHPPR